jgi:hypothetical protein
MKASGKASIWYWAQIKIAVGEVRWMLTHELMPTIPACRELLLAEAVLENAGQS